MTVRKNKRTIFLPNVRLTQEELNALKKEFETVFQPNFSEFIRHKLFAKKISEAHQKKFEAFISIGNLRGELNAIGNNVNQIAKRMNTVGEYETTQRDRQILAVLLQKLEVINSILDKSSL